MPPKARRRSLTATSPLREYPRPPPDPTNASHFECLQLAREKLVAHPVNVQGIMVQEALPMPRGGIDPRTDKSGYEEVFKLSLSMPT